MSRTREPGEFAGSHTTPSGRSAITTGSVIEPRSVRTVEAVKGRGLEGVARKARDYYNPASEILEGE